jgi:hypothetical protein
MANLDDAVKRLSSADFGKRRSFLLLYRSSSQLTRRAAETRLRIEAATAIRDGLEYYTGGQNYPAFLRRVMPAFVLILRGPCIFQSNSPEQVCLSSLQAAPR